MIRAAAFVLVCCMPALALAQAPASDDQAREHFVAGAAAFGSGRYEVALDEFRTSYELSTRPELLYNIGLCQDRLRLDQDALASFEGFLAALPETEHRAEVEARISALRAAIARDERTRLDAQASLDATQHHEEIWESPWLWIGVGAVVVAAIIVGVFFATQDPGVQAPIPGTDGTVMALRF